MFLRKLASAFTEQMSHCTVSVERRPHLAGPHRHQPQLPAAAVPAHAASTNSDASQRPPEAPAPAVPTERPAAAAQSTRSATRCSVESMGGRMTMRAACSVQVQLCLLPSLTGNDLSVQMHLAQ